MSQYSIEEYKRIIYLKKMKI